MYKLATYEADNVRQPATAAVMLSGFINGGANLYGPQPSSKIAIVVKTRSKQIFESFYGLEPES